MRSLLICLLSFIITSVCIAQDWSPRVAKKVDKHVKRVYALDGYKLEKYNAGVIPEQVVKGGGFYTVQVDHISIGYIHVAQAPSMKNVFDFIILYDNSFIVKDIKILVYREQHGRQIAEKRWLKQFFGKEPGQKVVYDDNIDGISGATISARNMTSAVNASLEVIQ